MREKPQPKHKTSRYLIFSALFLAILCLLIWIVSSRAQNQSDVFRYADSLLEKLYTVDADAVTRPSAEEYEVQQAEYEEYMSEDAAEALLLNRTPYRISGAVMDANGTTRFVSAEYERVGDTDQYKYIATVVLTLDGEETEIYPTGKIRIDSDGMVIHFSEVRRIDQLIDEI